MSVTRSIQLLSAAHHDPSRRQGTKHIRTTRCDTNERFGCSGRLASALFPVLERPHRHAEQLCELRLRQLGLCPGCRDGRRLDLVDAPAAAGLHLAHGLQQLFPEIALGIARAQFFL